MALNQLFYGDNLDVLRERVADESVDLVYLDPPFNSNRAFNVIFSRHDVIDDANKAQIQAFDDTWRWSSETDWQFTSAMAGGLPSRVAEAMSAMRTLLGENDAMAYLVNMAPRLVELHRTLKRTGSLYLHCDPTMSHYLKVLLDTIFGADKFRSEICWRRYGAHNDANGYGAVHDVLLYYTKSKNFVFNKQYVDYDEAYVGQRFRFSDADGRRWMEQNLASPNPRPNLTYPYTASNGITYQPPRNGWKVTPERMAELDAQNRLHYPAKANGRLRLKNYLDEGQGVPVQDVWSDIGTLGGTSPERIGYPTQKPVALLNRILSASTNPGDVVLDPFCGCGTAIDSSIHLGRRWLGIDITYIAVDLIEKRIQHRYGDGITATYDVLGIPKDTDGALALFARSPFEFERWAVSLLQGTPNQRQVGDRGVDGVIRFPVDARGNYGKALVSVKGGQRIGPQYVRDLLGTVQTQHAEMGVLATMARPTRGMLDAAAHAGNYVWPVNGQVFPRVQMATVPDLLAGRRPPLPTAIRPYIQASRRTATSDQLTLA